MLEIELLQVALGRRDELSCVPTATEWQKIYRFAEEQALIGVLFGGIERLPKNQLPEMSLLMDWLGQAQYQKEHNNLVNEDCQMITKVFRDAGFKTCIMKGQGNAYLYKAPFNSPQGGEIDLSMLRTSGDIDIWVDGGFEKVNAFVQSLSPTNEINELEIQLHRVCETLVEVHYRPFIMRNPWTNRRLQEFFAEEAENCFENGFRRVQEVSEGFSGFQVASEGFRGVQEVSEGSRVSRGSKGFQEVSTYFTTIRFNLIHQLAHIRLHLFTEGIGMKQLVDYYFVLLHSKEDKADIMRIVERLGMTNFARAMMWVMKEVMLIPDEHLLCEPDARGGRLLLGDVLMGGNFGKSNTGFQVPKSSHFYGIWALLIRNLRYWRFDHWDWICGPIWRVYHRAWKLKMGYK